MPRPRRLDGLPPHIDPSKIPAGIYWDRSGKGRWFVVEADDGRPRTRRVAGPGARLSELHELAESRRGLAPGTVAYALAQFHGSPQFAALAPRTRRDYEAQRNTANALPTKAGKFGALPVDRISCALLQRILDRIAAQHPTKANHLLRYLRRSFRWAINRGLCHHNPASGLEAAKESPRRRLPTHATIASLLAFAQAAGALPPHTRGSCAPYLWLLIEFGHLCRLRPVESMTLTDAAATPEGLHTNRRKGSRDSLVIWTPRLRAAWDAAAALRAAVQARHNRPIPMRPDQRPLFLSEDGTPLRKSSLDSAWQRLIRAAIAAGAITAEDRFGLHDLKRRGITDTRGRDAKFAAGGHRSEQMIDVYDLEVPAVEPAPGRS